MMAQTRLRVTVAPIVTVLTRSSSVTQDHVYLADGNVMGSQTVQTGRMRNLVVSAAVAEQIRANSLRLTALST